MPRKPRIDFPGLYHHVICRGIEGNKIFLDDRDRTYFLSKLSELIPRTGIVCLAWCILPNHFHMFVRVGMTPLSLFMRCLLTGYAVYFNKRHERSGHLFQNRYRSIVCDADSYLLELLRYIHLNPIRAGIVSDLKDLAGYRGCGHGVLLGRWNVPWQETQEVLAYFGNEEDDQRGSYLRFMSGGLRDIGKCDVEGNRVMEIFKKAEVEEGDTGDSGVLNNRVLGNGEFKKDIRIKIGKLDSTDEKYELSEKLLKTIADAFQIPQDHMKIKVKRGDVAEARSVFIYSAVRFGMSLSGAGKLLGIGRAAAWKSFKRGEVLLKSDDGLARKIDDCVSGLRIH